MNEAIDYIDVYGWQTEQIQNALDEAKRTSFEKFLSGEELDERLARFGPP